MSYSSRENTNKLLDLVDEGVLDPIQVLKAALSWHSDRDVGEMAEANEFILFEEEEEDEEEEDEEEEDEEEEVFASLVMLMSMTREEV